MGDEDDSIDVRPLPETRIANALPGLLLSVVCVMALGDDHPPEWLPPDWVLWCGIGFSLVLGARGARMGVYFRGERVIVRGQLLSRSIPTKQVVAVHDGMLPSLRWKTDGGRTVASPLLAFADFASTLPRYQEHRSRSLKTIRSKVGRAKRRGR